MNMTSPIDKVKEAAQTAHTVPRNRLQEVDLQYRSVSLQLRNLLGVERQHAQELKTLARQTCAELGVLQHMQSTGQCFKEFPTESFGWRNDQGLPELMPFSLDSATVAIRYTGQHKNLPSSVRPFYQDVANMLDKKVRRQSAGHFRDALSLGALILLIVVGIITVAYYKGAVSSDYFAIPILLLFVFGMGSGVYSCFLTQHLEVQAKFKGLIPEPVRRHIRELEKAQVFDEVFLLAEVPDLQITTYELPQPRSPRYGDPLVIGYDGTKFWLTKAFDTSPVEAIAQSTAI